MASNRVSSILAADFGSVQTRVVLFDIIEGEYRLIAHAAGRTTTGYPVDDTHVGLRRLLQYLTGVTGREFYNQVGRIVTPEDRARNGVDFFITTASAGRPIRTIIVGLVPEVSLTSALRAVSGTYIETVAEFHLRDGYTEEDRLNALMTGRPDLIFVAGGTDSGATAALQDFLDVIELALKIQDEELRPTILFAGNQKLQPFMEERFGELTELIFSSNIRPVIGKENIDGAQVALGKAFDEHRERHGTAFVTIGEMSSTGLLPTAESYRLVCEYLSKTRNTDVLVADMGSTSTILAASFGGNTNIAISTTTGLGQSATTLLEQVGEDAIAEWLPFYLHGSEIRNYALNKLSRPGSIPMDLHDMFIEQGMMRAGMRHMIQTARQSWNNVNNVGLLPPLGLIIVSGGALNGAGNPAYDIMMIADCIQPVGITEIKADRHGMLPPMSAIARQQPDAMVQLLDGDDLEHLGTLISLEGSSSKDGVAAKLVITTDEEPVNYDLKAGEYLSLPLPRNFSLKIKITCKGNYRIGGKRSQTLTLSGGTAGIVIDARGRPLKPPATVQERYDILPQWIASATDTEPMTLPDTWRLDPSDELGAAQLRRTQEMQALFEPLADEEDDFGDTIEDGEFAIDDLFADEDDDDFFDEDDDDDDIGSLRDLLD